MMDGNDQWLGTTKKKRKVFGRLKKTCSNRQVWTIENAETAQRASIEHDYLHQWSMTSSDFDSIMKIKITCDVTR